MAEHTFAESLKNLQDRLGELNAEGRVQCFPTALVCAIITPIVIWLILYFTQPYFVRKYDRNGASLQDNSKVLIWTAVITVVLYAIAWGVAWFSGYNVSSILCLVK